MNCELNKDLLKQVFVLTYQEFYKQLLHGIYSDLLIYKLIFQIRKPVLIFEYVTIFTPPWLAKNVM